MNNKVLGITEDLRRFTDMSDINDANDSLKLADCATLSLLCTLEDGEPMTQRALAAQIGVALGMTNSLLKRAIKKGLVKVSEAPAKRFAYYVTPKGFNEKSRLVAEYLSSSLSFFREAREEYSTLYDEIAKAGHTSVLLYGIGELAEIAVLSGIEAPVQLRGVIQVGSNMATFSDLPVLNSMEAAKAVGADAIVITCLESPQPAYDELRQHFPADRIFNAPMLHVRSNGLAGQEEGE